MLKYAVIFALGASLAAAQNRDLQFEVATIHTAATPDRNAILSGQMNIGTSVNGRQVTIRFASLRDMAVQAYEVKPFDVKAPEWMAQQRYDITALMPEGATEKDLPALMRSLLTERFKMVAHMESKEAQVYAMLEAKGGHKLKPAVELPAAPPPDPNQPAAEEAKPTGPGITVNGQRMSITQNSPAPGGGANVSINTGKNGTQKVTMGPDGQMHIEIERITMKELAESLTPMLDLPVEDHTGVAGSFQAALDMSMADMMGVLSKVSAVAGAAGIPPEAQAQLSQMAAKEPGGAVFGSVQKMGLRLEKQKATVQGLVIDSAEKAPSEN